MSTSTSGISLSSQMLVSSVLPLETSTAQLPSPLPFFGPIFPGPVALEDFRGFILKGLGRPRTIQARILCRTSYFTLRYSLEQIYENRGVSLRSLTVGTTCRWVENYTPYPLSLQGKCSRYPSCCRMDGCKSTLQACVIKKICFFCRRLDPDFSVVKHVAWYSFICCALYIWQKVLATIFIVSS